MENRHHWQGRIPQPRQAFRPDLIVSTLYPRRIHDEVLALAPSINFHPSLLPNHRGSLGAQGGVEACRIERSSTNVNAISTTRPGVTEAHYTVPEVADAAVDDL